MNFIFQTITQPCLSFIEGGVMLNNTNCNNKNFNKYAITGCKSCKPQIPLHISTEKIVILILKILILCIIISIFYPCCKFIPYTFCKLTLNIKKLLFK